MDGRTVFLDLKKAFDMVPHMRERERERDQSCSSNLGIFSEKFVKLVMKNLIKIFLLRIIAIITTIITFYNQ